MRYGCVISKYTHVNVRCVNHLLMIISGLPTNGRNFEKGYFDQFHTERVLSSGPHLSSWVVSKTHNCDGGPPVMFFFGFGELSILDVGS